MRSGFTSAPMLKNDEVLEFPMTSETNPTVKSGVKMFAGARHELMQLSVYTLLLVLEMYTMRVTT